MDENEGKVFSILKKIMVLLAVLLVCCCLALAGRFIYHDSLDQSAVVTVPDNLLQEGEDSLPEISPAQPGSAGTPEPQKREEKTQESQSAGTGVSAAQRENQSTPSAQSAEATVLELYRGRPDANQPFQVSNLLPGDSVTQYYCLRVYHNQPVKLVFCPTVTGQTKDLSSALKMSATPLGEENGLCQGTFAQVNGQTYSLELEPNAKGFSEVFYEVEVSADTSMGNAYQQATLEADFHWYAQDLNSNSAQPGGEGDALTWPQTGDPTHIVVWLALAGLALALAVLFWILGKKGRKKNG